MIERTLAEATTLADRAVFSALTAQLEPGQKAALDRLLVSEKYQDGLTIAETGKIMQKMEITQQHIAAQGQQIEQLQRLIAQLVSGGTNQEPRG